MTRLIILLLLIAAVVLAVSALAAFLNPEPAVQPSRRAGPLRKDKMPPTFRKIAYVLLVVLMFGVVTGWLGAA